MFIFCDVLHETKQKRKQPLESAQYELEISFNDEHLSFQNHLSRE